MSKYCIMCGNKLAEEDLFCGNCGAKQEVSESYEATYEEPKEEKSTDDRPEPEIENSVLESEVTPRNTDKSKRNKKAFRIAIGGVIIVGLIVGLAIFFLGNRGGLLSVDEIEQELSETYAKLWDGSDYEYDGITEFEVKSVDEDTHDEIFSCNVDPGIDNFMVLGLIKNGQIIQLQSIFLADRESMNQLEKDMQDSILAVAAFPVGIFNEDIDTPQNLREFLNEMEDINDATSSVPINKIMVDGDVEYTYMGGIGESDIVMSCLTIRYLPAFPTGFYEEEDGDDANEDVDYIQGEIETVASYEVYDTEFDEGVNTVQSNGGNFEASDSDIVHTHNFGGWQYFDDTYHARTCSCGELEKLTHTFDSGSITAEPTDSSTGVKTYTCMICYATKTETVAKLQHTHSFGGWVTYDTTNHIRTCSCGEREIVAHTYDSGRIKIEPTTSSTGAKVYTCTACAFGHTEIIPKLQHTHSFGGWTNDDANHHIRSCSCSEIEIEAHAFDSGQVASAPTSSSNGVMTYTCYTCGATKQESIPMLETVESMDTEQQRICWSCSHDDGTATVTMYKGQVIDASWTCSACGTYNQCTYEWN